MFDNKGKTMKRANLMVVVSLIVVSLFAVSGVSYGQAPSNPRVPDYTGWPKVAEANAWFILNGKPTRLLVEQYRYTDMVNLRRYLLSLVYNEQKSVWIAVLNETTCQKLADDRIVTKDTYYYIFEYNGTDWMLAEDLSGSQDVEGGLTEVFRMRYGLEFK